MQYSNTKLINTQQHSFIKTIQISFQTQTFKIFLNNTQPYVKHKIL